jgi:hypothetical protein
VYKNSKALETVSHRLAVFPSSTPVVFDVKIFESRVNAGLVIFWKYRQKANTAEA